MAWTRHCPFPRAPQQPRPFPHFPIGVVGNEARGGIAPYPHRNGREGRQAGRLSEKPRAKIWVSALSFPVRKFGFLAPARAYKKRRAISSCGILDIVCWVLYGGGMTRLTHTQYEALVSYEHGHASWRPYKPRKSLTTNGWLKVEPRTGGDMYVLTQLGWSALVEYRERHGLRAPA